MAFTSVSNRITNMPLVLVGPILRRVTANSVSVFIVTQESKNVTLTVNNDSDVTVLSQTSGTIALGGNVHALVITASSTTDVLITNTVYNYNLSFNGTPMVQSNGDLTEGILINSHYQLPEGIAYGNQIYPTFILPSDDKQQLKFSHGSCRKPHGGKTDALRGLDTILSATISNETQTVEVNERPQFLCLTGDQIYADDVPDLLLYMLIDLEENIFNWAGSNVREQLPGNPTEAQLNPGKRFPLVGENEDDTTVGKFSQSESSGKSHLIKLAEYYGMYLMVWSDVLWPTASADFPTFEQVSDNAPRTKTYDVHFNHMVNNSMMPIHSTTTVTEKTDRYKQHLEEIEPVTEFHRSLKYVRKALANIPVYMIFDDHEITDDWFLTRKWVENALSDSTMSKRIIQNGVTAFAIFQAWGNTPQLFSSGKGQDILNEVQAIHTAGPNLTNFTALADLVLPELTNNGRKLQKKNSNNVDWNFHIDFDVFRLIILDTRTKRGFSEDESAPELIHSSYLSEQISTGNANFSIVVSPAPVFGNVRIERIQRIFSSGSKMAGLVGGVGAVVFGSVGAIFWSKRGGIIGAGIGAGAGALLGWALSKNYYEVDFEAWVFQEDIFHEFLLKLSAFQSTILLSGDVHYGFSSTIEFWKKSTSGSNWSASGISQICSSSLKNSDSKTETAATLSLIKPKLRGEDSYIVESKVGNEDIKYRTFFETDERSRNDRFGSPPITIDSSNEQYEAGYQHRNSISWDSHRYVVGRDNICFAKMKDNGNKLSHEFWFAITDEEEDSDQYVLNAGTIHEVFCSVSDSSPTF